MMQAMVAEAPLRSLLMFGGDAMNRGVVNGILLMINGKFLKGLSLLLKSRK